MKKASIDIENAHTQKVKTIVVPVIEHIEDKIIKFDISKLNDIEKEELTYAISEDPKYEYTDIEMFFINNEKYPNFGPDYNFYIKDNSLVGIYNRNIYLRKEGR